MTTTFARFALAAITISAIACGSKSTPPNDADADDDAATLDGGEDAAIDAGLDGGVTSSVPTNDDPSPRTAALYAYLTRQVARPTALFGQQHASWEGHDMAFDSFETDIYNALEPELGTAARHPAVFGWNYETWVNGNGTLRTAFRDRIIASDAAGGVTTIHWPIANYIMDCRPLACTDNSNDGRDLVDMIANNATYTDWRDNTDHLAGDVLDAKVDELATFLKSLRSADGELIPVIVRPFHEMNREKGGGTGHWWAGRNPEDYRIMWQRFVDRLRITNGVTNALFAFAPRGELLFTGDDTPAALYAKFWPETDPSTTAGRYVDVAAFDDYLLDDDLAQEFFDAIDTTYAFAIAADRVVPRVSAVAECGRKHGTGSGCTSGPVCYQDGRFWTERILPGMNANGGVRWTRTAYLMTWTNGTFSTYSGAPTAQASDFKDWFEEPATLFLGEGETF